MAEDLEDLLVEAFRPVPVAVRHVDLIFACRACGRRVGWFYPTLGLPCEVRALGASLAGKVCDCGAVLAGDEAALEARTVAVDPAERGYGYCQVPVCQGLVPLANLAPGAFGPTCRSSRLVEAAVAEMLATGDDPWV